MFSKICFAALTLSMLLLPVQPSLASLEGISRQIENLVWGVETLTESLGITVVLAAAASAGIAIGLKMGDTHGDDIIKLKKACIAWFLQSKLTRDDFIKHNVHKDIKGFSKTYTSSGNAWDGIDGIKNQWKLQKYQRAVQRKN